MSTANGKGKRRQRTAEIKARVALAAIKGDRPVNEIAAMYGVHPKVYRSSLFQIARRDS